MKRILITGANSYIGMSFETFMAQWPEAYQVDTVDMIDGTWREKDFSQYDCVFHVAGIAHQKETNENATLYYSVNRDLAAQTAQKAKSDGVRQFVFLSSMSVYGMDIGVITRQTQPAPQSHYGRSKWEAEQKITSLEAEDFKVCILRPPMVYGKDCKGNFVKIKKLVEKLPIFPNVKNQRSMIYIDNLSSFVKLCVDQNLQGLHFPQNKDYVSTIDLARGIGFAMNKNVHLDPITGMGVMILRKFHPTAQKAFGSLIYDIDEPLEYCIVSNEESIRRSV